MWKKKADDDFSRLCSGRPHQPPMPKPGDTVVEIPRVCAVFDQPYIARYVRNFWGYDWSSAVRIDARGSHAAPPGQSTTFDTNGFRGLEVCPWCGAEDIAFCEGGCYQWVCEGRTRRKWRGDYFRCRASCVGRGWLRESDAGFYGSLVAALSPSRWQREPPQQVAARVERPALPGSAGKTALPANSNMRALPGADRRRLK